MKDRQYFSHDYNSRNDPKLRKVRKKYKSAGIGCYWMIVEMIYEQGGHLPYDTDDLAFDMQEDGAMVDDLIHSFGLFENDGKIIWSNSINERLELRKVKSEKASFAGKKSAEKRALLRENPTDVEHPLNTRSTIKVKESKVKENKEKNREGSSALISASPHSLENSELSEVQNREILFYKSLVAYLGTYSKEMIRSFYDYWRERTKSGKKMKWELERTWDMSLRLKKWQSNEDKWAKHSKLITNDTTDTTAERMERLLSQKAEF